MNFINLDHVALATRKKTLEMCIATGGHIVSSFSCVEILVALYYGGELNLKPQADPNANRDRFILSKGHAETVFYVILADLGYFPKEQLDHSYRQNSCLLGGHPDHSTPGVEVTTGSLGHGLGIAAGMATAFKMDGKLNRVFTLMGDAECTEGSIWESAMYASHMNLDNLVGIIDRNGLGCLDFTSNYTGLDSLEEKWAAFGWNVITVDGHSISALNESYSPMQNGKPTIVIANTVKGKGISFMENDKTWHVKGITGDLADKARQELGI